MKEIATGVFNVFSSAAFSTAERSNWVARPGIVGRKNGAALGFFGGAFGLFLALITSRFNRFSHLQSSMEKCESEFVIPGPWKIGQSDELIAELRRAGELTLFFLAFLHLDL